MQRCYTCKEEKPLESFNFRDRAKGLRSSVCKTCHSEYRKQHYQDNRQKYIDKAAKRDSELKAKRLDWLWTELIEKGCSACGEKDLLVLDLDHIVPLENGYAPRFRRFMGYSDKKFFEELEKCQILCCNCHRRKTAIENNWSKIKWIESYGLANG